MPSPPTPTSSSGAQPGAPAGAPVKILVVDDLAEKLLVYRSILEEPGLQLVTASSGGEALARVLESDFAVILLDVNMPDMDGFEAATLIRSRRKCAHIPLIFITAHADDMHAHRGYAHGAVDYIVAPVVPEILRTKVNVFAELFRLRRQVEAQAAERVARAEHEQGRASRRAEETRAQLAAIIESTEDAVLGKSLDGVITSCNPAALRLFGYTAAELIGQPVTLLVPEERLDEEREFLLQLRAGKSPPRQIETVRIAKGGRRIDMALTVSPVFGEGGAVIGASTIARDITERKLAEEELRRHRERLEQLVAERTQELEASHHRLRMADRLASIGTLAAGLGHDMGNLLMPLRMRLDTLAEMDLPAQAKEDLAAIESASEYLKRLSHGLRLFALNPEDLDAAGDHTDLHAWWAEVQPFLRNAVGREISLEARLAADLPHIAMSPHVLTQAVYNLVKNAGDALSGRGSGSVNICAVIVRSDPVLDRAVVLSVSDDGPGMTDEVRRRCLEPFFTTKTRAISTGLGLTLVCGSVRSAGGRVEIESASGKGTTFRLTLPVHDPDALADSDQPSVGRSQRTDAAWVHIEEPRMQALVCTILRAMGLSVVGSGPPPFEQGNIGSPSIPRLLVLNGDSEHADIADYLRADPARRIVVFADEPVLGRSFSSRAAYIGRTPDAAAVRTALLNAASRPHPATAHSVPQGASP